MAHASTATNESLKGPGPFGTSVSLVRTQATAADQKWQKTTLIGGFATYKLLSSIGTGREMCLSASAGNPRPFAAVCNPSSLAQQWHRGFLNDGRIENRAAHQALTRLPNGFLEMRVLRSVPTGQSWHEHPVS